MTCPSRPIHENLPTELLVEITDALVAMKSGSRDIIRLTTVDKTMREIVLSRPLYWTNIRLDQSLSSATFAKLCVERSKEEPVTLDIEFLGASWPPHAEDIFRIIRLTQSRIKELSVIINTFDLLRAFRTALPRFEMPILTKLFLDYDTVFYGGADQNRDIALPKKSALRTLTLAGVVRVPSNGAHTRTCLLCNSRAEQCSRGQQTL